MLRLAFTRGKVPLRTHSAFRILLGRGNLCREVNHTPSFQPIGEPAVSGGREVGSPIPIDTDGAVPRGLRLASARLPVVRVGPFTSGLWSSRLCTIYKVKRLFTGCSDSRLTNPDRSAHAAAWQGTRLAKALPRGVSACRSPRENTAQFPGWGPTFGPGPDGRVRQRMGGGSNNAPI
jgi:hypothetical protein